MEALEGFQKWANQDSELLPKAEKQQLLLEAGSPAGFLPPQATRTKEPVAVSSRSGSGDKYNLINRK
jgi:hypothetical protein